MSRWVLCRADGLIRKPTLRYTKESRCVLLSRGDALVVCSASLAYCAAMLKEAEPVSVCRGLAYPDVRRCALTW